VSTGGSAKLRVLQVAENYPPQYGGGAGVVIRDVCHALATIGHELRVLSVESRQAPAFAARVEYDGPIRVERVNLPYFMDQDPEGWRLGVLAWRKHERRVTQLFDEQLANWRPDIVQYNATRPFGEAGPLAVYRHAVPMVAMLHEAWFICPRMMLLRSPLAEPCSGPAALKCTECMYSEYDGGHTRTAVKFPWRLAKLRAYPAYRLWRRRSARRALAGAIGYSNFMVRVHQPHMRGRVDYLPVGVNLEGLPDQIPERPRSPFRFGFLAGGQSTKGAWDLLDAAANLKLADLDFEIHIWGPGQEGLPSEIEARGIQERVVLRGTFDREARWSVYQEIDVVVVPTTVAEPATRIPHEAAAAGVPSLASNVGGNPESVGVNGLLFQFKDVTDLARQMRRLLEEPGLYEGLRDGISRPPDTRTKGAEVEATYRAVLGNGLESKSPRRYR